MADKSKTGTKEWAETTLNIAKGCEHNCRYCYARNMLVDRFKKIKPGDWTTMVVNKKVIDAPQGLKQGVIMIPSSHDITPSILPDFLCVLRKLLESGNQVLIVTKPHLECITAICKEFSNYRSNILFRFTIGSTQEDVIKFWEPGAPPFHERIACLIYAFAGGFQTSVSCEPYLDAWPDLVYAACEEYLSESFWIGTIKHFNARVKLDDITDEQREKYVCPLLRAQKDAAVKLIHKQLNGEPFVQWKDSITEIIGK